MSHFVYRMIPPRPTFAEDMAPAEAAVMGEHGAYWKMQLDADRVLAFGPVSDPAGTWGLGILAVGTRDEALALVERDPAITSGLARFELHAMDAVVRERA